MSGTTRRFLASLLVAAVVGGLNLATAGVAVGAEVDPSTLTPEPPPGAVCEPVNSVSVLCMTVRDFNQSRARVFDLPCGPVYANTIDHRDGVRWYVRGKAVRKHVHGTLTGTWSRSRNGTGKAVKIAADWSEWTVWPAPGDDDTAAATSYGLQFRATGPGLGNAIIWFGRVDPDSSAHGIKVGFLPGAGTLAQDFQIDGHDLNAAAMSALARALC